jgi:hypothetical protein
MRHAAHRSFGHLVGELLTMQGRRCGNLRSRELWTTDAAMRECH